jgi:hypothetical protein
MTCGARAMQCCDKYNKKAVVVLAGSKLQRVALELKRRTRINLMANGSYAALASVAIHVKPKSQAEADRDYHAQIKCHDQQHEVVRVEAVQRVKNSALNAVQSVLRCCFARVARQEQRHGGFVQGFVGLNKCS